MSVQKVEDDLRRKTEAMEKRVAEAEAAKKRAEEALSAAQGSTGRKLAKAKAKGKSKAKGKAKKKKGKGRGKGAAKAASQPKVRYDRELLEMASSLAADGQISHPDAEKLWASAMDGPGLTANEKATLEHLMEEYTFTQKAATYMQEQLEKTPIVTGVAAETAIVVAKQPKSGSLAAIRKKVLDGLGAKSLDDALAEAKGMLKTAEGVRDEAKAMFDAHDKQLAAANQDLDAATQAAKEAVGKEQAAATKLRELKDKKKVGAAGTLSEGRVALLEAQKKLAMVEVIALNRKRMKELEAMKKAATDAAEAAKKNLQDQRQKEKEQLEATRKQLADAKAATTGKKRTAATEEASPAKTQKVDAHAGDID